MSNRIDNKIEQVIRNGIYLFVWFAWTTFGFVVWCAILTRAMLAYTAGLFARIISEGDTQGLDASLDYAVRFWFSGFERLQRARLRSSDTPNMLTAIDEKRFVYESLYTVGFVLAWGIISPLLRAIIWWLIVTAPWLAFLAGIVLFVILCAAIVVSVRVFRHSPPPLPKPR
jgi:hypothetical protein